MENAVQAKFNSYPEKAQTQLLKIREAILELGREENIGKVTETLKWGQPSYLAKKGSTVRIDWAPNSPEYISVYFNCQSSLVETFKEIYPNCFQFVGNRQLVLPISEQAPSPELISCISMALRYHSIKHLPLLGG